MSLAALLLAASGGGGGGLVIYLIIYVIVVIGMWKVFVKAGHPGWAAIIPIYNTWVLLKIVGRPGWWIILFLIPFVDLIAWIVVAYDGAKSFGKGVGFTVGLVILPFIFWPILGYGSDQYLGPRGMGASYGGYSAAPAGVPGGGQWGYQAAPGTGAPYGGGAYGSPAGTAGSPPPAGSAAPANWYPDPTGRHELRYFDGSRWTDHVSDAGSQATDPV